MSLLYYIFEVFIYLFIFLYIQVLKPDYVSKYALGTTVKFEELAAKVRVQLILLDFNSLFFAWGICGQVVRVVDIESLVLHLCVFRSHQGLH